MNLLIEIISKVSPFLSTLLGGPAGGLVATLLSQALGGIDMNDPQKVVQVLQDPAQVQKLKELELQLRDLQNARDTAQKDTGIYKIVRPLLAIISMFSVAICLYAINHIDNQLVEQVLVVLLIVLVWDIRQVYKFYFGSGDELPNIPFFNKKK